MAKKKQTPAGRTPAAKRSADRQINFRPTPEIDAALEAYRNKLRQSYGFAPSHSDVMRQALRMYLAAHGFPTPDAAD